jgi:DNA-binding response OmpR family regulator
MAHEVLFVEDDDDVREIYTITLREAGFTVVALDRAAAVLEALERRLPAVILLDLFMPPGEMSGIELLTRLRERADWAQVPVVVLSGLGDVLNRDLLERLGVRDVLLKGQARDTDIVQAIRDALRP